jgi:hypothetical protein
MAPNGRLSRSKARRSHRLRIGSARIVDRSLAALLGFFFVVLHSVSTAGLGVKKLQQCCSSPPDAALLVGATLRLHFALYLGCGSPTGPTRVMRWPLGRRIGSHLAGTVASRLVSLVTTYSVICRQTAHIRDSHDHSCRRPRTRTQR